MIVELNRDLKKQKALTEEMEAKNRVLEERLKNSENDYDKLVGDSEAIKVEWEDQSKFMKAEIEGYKTELHNLKKELDSS